MNLRIFSLHWDNIDREVVTAQKAVFDHFGLPINQHRIDGFQHGEWIDWVMNRTEEADVFLFIDTDCIPLSKARMIERIRQAASGTLVGAEGAPNHLSPLRAYAGAWYVYVNRRVWHMLHRPSAKASQHCDVAQLWTDAWLDAKLPVELIPPTACLEPRWDLPGRAKGYGVATTYGDDCFHLFESRNGRQQLFIDRCRQLLDTAV